MFEICVGADATMIERLIGAAVAGLVLIGAFELASASLRVGLKESVLVDRLNALLLRDPIADADAAIAQLDFRLMYAHVGHSGKAPGVYCKAGNRDALRRYREYYSTGDVFVAGGVEEKFLMGFGAFASIYNRRIVRSADYPDKHVCQAIGD